jgi:DNA-directed RNA polymerase specialized sigma24 family protein
MSVAMDRMVNDAFRVLRKRVRLFARRHVENPADLDDMTNDACEKAFKRFRALSAQTELTQENLGHFMAQAYRRGAVALIGARIDQYRKQERERRLLETMSHDLIAGSWLGGIQHEPEPDQRIIVSQTMAAVLRYSTTPSQKRLGEALRRHVERGELDLTPSELAEEAREPANSRHGWARKLKTKQLN